MIKAGSNIYSGKIVKDIQGLTGFPKRVVRKVCSFPKDKKNKGKVSIMATKAQANILNKAIGIKEDKE